MKTTYKYTCCILAAALWLLSACTASRPEFDITSRLIPVDAHWDRTPEPQMEAIVSKYKASVDSVMRIVIGTSSQYMEPKRPGSLLTNLSADIIKSEAPSVFGQPVDLAITNIGGIRNPLMQGEITLGEIYSIFPFDNTLCLIKLKGSDLRDLFDIIASRGGEAVSHEVRMTIADDKAANLTIDGTPLDDNRIYSIATIDYVANGGDHMTPCLKATERKNSAAFLRDVVINYIEKATQAKRAISALDEARITPAKPQ